jgi:UDP-N-acetylglucosamine/UDP-N-acetylgalactosamine 4-epimerase
MSQVGHTKALWLVTGAAGFIGSNIVETLLLNGERVRALDSFATGHRSNLESVRQAVGETTWKNFEFVEGDIRSIDTCKAALKDVDYVTHQAGLGSVPRSLSNPLATNDTNVTGFLNMLECSRLAGIKSFVYAASSSTYGDEANLPKQEHRIGNPLSPYAVTKLVNELYAAVYLRSYDFRATGLRYFNVFGPRQDPDGAYAAVIPKWVSAMIKNETVAINGDGESSRDFCFVKNAVEANIKAALAPAAAQGEVYNVAVGERTTLNQLFALLRDELARLQIHYGQSPLYKDFRKGDVRHSQADITKARNGLGYAPQYNLERGVREALPWYVNYFSKATPT